ncbi:hypothetical protein GCM10022419_112800 [Nonomuraea rosea]|uniref:Histidine kinase/HSP90-like ATPase domain-containing protein n=2 Tax=Nonomuraea rosea TaxID=638574 RepID=A0ABP6ZKM3_9ACTN
MNDMAWCCGFPGEPSQLREVRRRVGTLLENCPIRDDVISCMVELAANAITHTKSFGGVFTVGIWLLRARARIAVKDAGGPGEPVVRPSCQEEMAEGGRGLAIVAALSARLGVAGDERGRVVWADLTWGVGDPARPGQPSSAPSWMSVCGECWGFGTETAHAPSSAAILASGVCCG